MRKTPLLIALPAALPVPCRAAAAAQVSVRGGLRTALNGGGRSEGRRSITPINQQTRMPGKEDQTGAKEGRDMKRIGSIALALIVAASLILATLPAAAAAEGSTPEIALGAGGNRQGHVHRQELHGLVRQVQRQRLRQRSRSVAGAVGRRQRGPGRRRSRRTTPATNGRAATRRRGVRPSGAAANG